MPQFNLLLLPLLGGFLFVSLWYPTKYYTKRADTYRLVFTASIAGAVFLLFSCILTALIELVPEISQPIYRFWLWLIPGSPRNLGRATTAFLLGASLWWVGNKLCSDSESIKRAITNRRDPLEMLLRRALGENKMISVSVSSGKVYVGYLRVNFNPAYDMESISIFPVSSGYRDKDTQIMRLTLDYTKPYEAIREEIRNELNKKISELAAANSAQTREATENLIRTQIDKNFGLENFTIAIPMSEVQSVNIFEPEIYKRHFESLENQINVSGSD